MRNILWIMLGAALLITSCGTSEKPDASSESISANQASTASVADSVGSASVIRTAELRLQFDSLKKTRQSLSFLLRKHQAYIAHEHEGLSTGRLENTIEIRVPQQSLSPLIEELCTSAKYVEQKELSVDDVSMEFIDVQARLKAKQELEKRYLQLLQRAGKISEMLEVERQMNIVRSDIEVMQGRLNYLHNKVAMATLTVSMYEIIAVSAPQGRGFFTRAGENFIRSFGFLKETILLAITIWPILLITATALLILRQRKRKLSLSA
jgi:hypothetical protein